jgi:hypothetical protein
MTSRSTTFFAVALATLAPLSACAGGSHFADAGLDARRMGTCDPDRVRPPGDYGFIVTECTHDSDCADGLNGRCSRRGAYSACTYDLCFSDADCPAGTRCACGVERQDGNLCVSDLCGACARIDCAVSWGCEGHNGTGSGGGVQSFECYTPDDTCHSDADCDTGEFCTRGPGVRGEQPDPSWHCASPTCGP